MPILVTRSSMPPFEEYCEEIKDLWDSRWLTNMGEKHKELQSELEKKLGVNHVTLYTNGHMALEGVLKGLDLPVGGEIITTPFTFISTTNAIVRAGYKPVFCDIEDKNYTIDPSKIESLITDKTVAILPVHVYGNVCEVEEIQSIAKKHGLKVIYDAAHAFGVTYKGKSIAQYGDTSMFSFHATKVFNTIEGGCVCYHDDELVSILDSMKNFGAAGNDDYAYIGGNAKMSEFHAAMGLCNLKHLEEEISKRKAIVLHYIDRLHSAPGIKLCDVNPDMTSNYAYFPVVFWEDDFGTTRDIVLKELSYHDIFARKYFYPLTNEVSCYTKYEKGNTPIAKSISERVLTLPLFADLELEQVDQICSIVLGCRKL